MTRAERAAALVEALPRIYPDAHCELIFADPLQLLVATILSAQCTDKRVNIVTKELFRVCRTARDYAEIEPAKLEALVQSTGFFRSKARNIRDCCAALVAKHGGSVPKTMEELTALAGVGRKTANVVLGNVFGLAEGVVVDTHVQRLSTRLGLTRQKTPEKIEHDLIRLIPREKWTLFS
ncbi:MAG: endonuclease III, partial [Chthoniobacteraceae bacterium]